MNAPQRSAPDLVISPSVRRAVIAPVMANDQVRQAMEEILKCVRGDCKDAGRWEEELIHLACLAAGVWPGSPKERYAKGSGKSWKALNEFPGRLRKMAEEIQHLSGGYYYFDPARAITSGIPWDLYAKYEFSLLPTTLKDYASWLEEQVAKLLANYGWSNDLRPSRERSYFTLRVSKKIESITGRFLDRQVAELLNAVELAMHPNRPDSDKGFDAQAIVLLRYRQKRRLRKT